MAMGGLLAVQAQLRQQYLTAAQNAYADVIRQIPSQRPSNLIEDLPQTLVKIVNRRKSQVCHHPLEPQITNPVFSILIPRVLEPTEQVFPYRLRNRSY